MAKKRRNESFRLKYTFAFHLTRSPHDMHFKGVAEELASKVGTTEDKNREGQPVKNSEINLAI